MNSHTPGPWRVEASLVDFGRDPGTTPFEVGPKDGFMPFGACGCCNSPWMEGDTTEAQVANARLIAAAPEMWELLQAIDSLRLGGMMARDMENGAIRDDLTKINRNVKAVLAKIASGTQ